MNNENVKPDNLRPSSAPVKVPLTKTPAKKYQSSCCTPKSVSRPTTATKKAEGTPISSREAAIQAKAQLTAEKQKRTSLLKQKWAEEKQQRKKEISKKREEDFKMRQRLSDLASKNRQKNIQKSNEFKKAKMEKERELLKSSVTEHIEARKKLEEAEKKRRRQSVMINKQILLKAKKNEAKMMQKLKEDDENMYLSRRVDFLSVREGKLEEEEMRRKSLEAKNEYCRMQHELQKELDMVKQEQEKDILAVRRDMSADDAKTRENEKINRRQSLINRLDTWRSQRQIDDALKKKQQDDIQLNIIQKHEDWMDIQEAKREYQERSRQSIVWRLDKWRETKDLEAQEAMQKQMEEENARELFLQDYEDVLQYKQEQEDLRRLSLAYRLDQAAREREWERGEQYVQTAEMENERIIAAEERYDVAQYKKQLEEDRRASLAFRLEEQLKDKQFYAGQTANQKALSAKDNDIKQKDRLAVNEYKESLRQKERQEVAKNIAVSQKQKEKALVEHRKMLDKMHEDFESKSMDWRDVQDYKAREKERSRQSICLRLESWRKQRLASERLKAKQQQLDAEDAAMRSADYLAMRDAAAQQALKERERNIKCFL